MKHFTVKLEPVSSEQIARLLKERNIFTNPHAELYFAHPRFSSDRSEELSVAVASLREIGLENGATLEELFRFLPRIGGKPCPFSTGLFLRLAWTDQPNSRNSVLSGAHSAPDGSVTVLSEIMEQSDAFPKGLYLRRVDGNLWLRGYVCDSLYRFPDDAMIAYQTGAAASVGRVLPL